MTHLFISHSTRDGAAIAQQLSAALEAAGHRCWIAPRDVKPGVPYPGQIVTAIEASAGLVLLVTPAANESPDVLQEIQLASTARKMIAPVIVSSCAPAPDLRYFIGVRHQIAWRDGTATTHDLLRSFPVGLKIDSGGQPGAAADVEPVARRASAATGDQLFDVVMLAPALSDRRSDAIRVVRGYNKLDLMDAKRLVESKPPVHLGVKLTYRAAFNYVSQLRAIGYTMADPVPSKD